MRGGELWFQQAGLKMVAGPVRLRGENKTMERTMNIFDRLIAIKLDEDFTETTWWTDAVYRGLEQDADELSGELEAASAATPTSTDLA
jgi:hypothetical protein